MIEINNLTKIPLPSALLKKLAQKVIAGENKKERGHLSLAFLGEEKMKNLNRKYLGKNRAADLLAFSGAGYFFKNGPGPKLFGEVLICPKVLKKRAKREGVSFKRELKKALVHGVLHLFGYDHQKPKSAGIMEAKEKLYLKNI